VRIVALLVVAGCGRLHFAESSDAAGDTTADTRPDMAMALGHDEDGDGIPDSLDPCPHVAGDATDTDGDGVGDACDPNGGSPTEHWVLFATMQAGNTGFDDVTGFTQEADSIRIAGNVFPNLTMPIGKYRIDLGFDIHAIVGTGQHQVALGVDDPSGTEYYFGELNDNGAGGYDAAIVQYDGTTGYTTLDGQNSGAFHTGSGLIRLDVGPAHKLYTGWTGQMYMLNASTPAYVSGDYIRFAFNGTDISIRYIAIIATN
jgi:hypothetical protein